MSVTAESCFRQLHDGDVATRLFSASRHFHLLTIAGKSRHCSWRSYHFTDVPAMLVAGSVSLAKILSGRHIRWRESVATFAQAFVPLGFSMWLAHFSYHLVNGALTAVPVIQRAARSAGLSILGKPDWSLSASMSSFDWLPSAQLLVLGLGLLLTLYIGWRLASSFRLKFARTLGMAAPWAFLALVLYVAGVWIVFQPMQMRGMMMDGTTEWCVSK